MTKRIEGLNVPDRPFRVSVVHPSVGSYTQEYDNLTEAMTALAMVQDDPQCVRAVLDARMLEWKAEPRIVGAKF